jgi:hypothetical protein
MLCVVGRISPAAVVATVVIGGLAACGAGGSTTTVVRSHTVTRTIPVAIPAPTARTRSDVLAAVKADFRAGRSRRAHRHFVACFLPKFRAALTRARLLALLIVGRERGAPAVSRRVNAVAVSPARECVGATAGPVGYPVPEFTTTGAALRRAAVGKR